MEWDEHNMEYRILEHARPDETVVWPVKEQDGRWERGWERVSREAADYRVQRTDDGLGGQEISIHFIQRMDEHSVPKTWWDDSKYASSNHGAKILKALFVDNPFDYPKSVPLVEDCIRTSGGGKKGAHVFDCFAGSGSTGHAVINLNRQDGGRRRYVLVEMGRYFDTVILPRMKKVVYSSDWTDGKPGSRQGVSQIIKYVRLESYEDSMDSLEVLERSDVQETLLVNRTELAKDYRLRYMLGVETAGSACLLGRYFSDPTAYSLSVVRDGMRVEVRVDLRRPSIGSSVCKWSPAVGSTGCWRSQAVTLRAVDVWSYGAIPTKLTRPGLTRGLTLIASGFPNRLI